MAATDSGFSENLPLVRPLDEEQARLVEILLAADGSEVSFEELRRQGIESPAVLAYELEIAGLPIAHVQRLGAGGRASAVGLRLDATVPLQPTPRKHTRGREPRKREPRGRAPLQEDPANRSIAAAGNGGASSSATRPRRDLTPGIAIGLAAFVLIVIVVVLAGGTGSGAGNGGHAGLAQSGSGASHAAQAPGAPVSAIAPASTTTHKTSHHTHHAPTPAAPPPPLSHAAQLQQAGHLLLAEGRYSAAIPELRAAIGASGESASNCSEPSTPGCVAYAEALYDLGRALRLDNANAAAGAVLRERLRIDSQRTAVQHEIGLDHRRHATTPTSRPPAPHAKTPDTTTTPKSKPAPAPTPRPITGGAAAPAP